MILRYSRPEMRAIWTDENKLQLWLQIELLTSEALVKEGEADGTITDPTNGRTKAVCLLMALNRQIYLACPEVPTLAQRWLSFLRTHGPQPMVVTNIRRPASRSACLARA